MKTQVALPETACGFLAVFARLVSRIWCGRRSGEERAGGRLAGEDAGGVASDAASGKRGPRPGHYVTFTMGRHTFALDVGRVCGVVNGRGVRIRGAVNPDRRGLVSWNGSEVPVLDLRVRYGIRPARVTWRSSLVVVEFRRGGGATRAAFIADAMGDLVAIDQGEVQPAPRLGAAVPQRYVLGVVEREGVRIIVIDIDAVYGADELASMAGREHPVVKTAPGPADG